MTLRIVLCLALLSPLAYARDVEVRVLSLFSLTQVSIAPNGDLQWRRCGACRPQPAGAVETVRAEGDGLVYGRIRARELVFSGSYRVESDRASSIAPAFPLRVRARAGRLILTIRMPLEDYVAAVLHGETAPTDPEEALKALAVAVRTYAVRFAGHHRAEGFDFCDSTHCQFLRLGPSERARRAADDTRGQLLWYRGQLARTYFHQDCGGATAAAEQVWPDMKAEYLAEHPDAYCVAAGNVRWQSDLTRQEVETALAAAGVRLPRSWSDLVIATRWPSGRVRQLRAGRVLMAASTFRFAIGRAIGWQRVRSDWYDLEARGASFHLSGRGSGHGVGLCQFGASEMARQGRRYQEILAFYYPGTGVGDTAGAVAWTPRHGATLDVETAHGCPAAGLLALAERAHSEARTRSGLSSSARPVVRAYPTVASFRDATGEPGWVGASTRGRVIHLQPVPILQARHMLEATLRHEFLHLLVESNRRAALPLWFREGLVLYLDSNAAHENDSVSMNPAAMDRALAGRTSPEQMKMAYAAARLAVARLVARHGESEVMRWLGTGIPASALLDARPNQAGGGAQN